MNKIILVLFFITSTIFPQKNFESDTIKTDRGELIITFIGHGSLMFSFNKMIIQVDPFSRLADYSSLPKADMILVTHHHGDHFDTSAINKIRIRNTITVLTETAAKNFSLGIVMKNGDTLTLEGIKIEAVPAYNIVHKRDNGEPFHPKGICNGYVLTFGDKRIYIAGDTENVPEMKELENIDIAFLPVNLPFTMTPEMAADAAKAFRPGILYPYHFGETDMQKFSSLMEGRKDIEIRMRDMK